MEGSSLTFSTLFAWRLDLSVVDAVNSLEQLLIFLIDIVKVLFMQCFFFTKALR